MRILSWNVNGIRAAYKKGLGEWLTKEQPDILCLQETKANIEQLSDDIINIGDYESHFVSAQKKGYSGVGIYTRIEPKSIKSGFSIERFDSEGRVIIADYEAFLLINIYFPNGGASAERLQYKMDFYEECLNFLKKLLDSGHKIVLCGDVNTAHKEIDLARPKENESTSGFLPMERQWIDKLIECGFIDTFREFEKDGQNYTWWDQKTRARLRNVGWRIDYFFISENLKKCLKSAFILSDVLGSDHCPIGIELEEEKLWK